MRSWTHRLISSLAGALVVFSVGQAAGQYLTIQLAGPSEGVTQPWKTMFHSHNQKVVENANGIFCTSHGVALDRSTNGGLTFTKVYDRGLDHEGYRPPTIETDENNNLYLIYPNVDNSRTRFEKFTSANGYTSPTITTEHSQASSASKFASAYDPGRGRLYHATQGGYFFSFDKSGNFVAGKQVWTTGSTGSKPQYPCLFLDDTGVLHFAQTTVDGGTGSFYETIRYLKSTDGGSTWRKMDGTVVSTPVSCNPDDGNSTQINIEDEETVNTWLANMFVRDGKVHFQYRARSLSPERQHYMRFNATTGVREIDSWTNFPNGDWKGSALEINSISGCFASDPADPDGPLFAIAAVAGDRIGALVSFDNGSTWLDYARSADLDMVDYVGCFRYGPKYGHFIGTFSGAPGGIWATALFYRVLFPVPGDATLTQSDPLGQSSFDMDFSNGNYWDTGGLPWRGNNYFTGPHTLRTPTGSATFNGDSLRIDAGGALLLKQFYGNYTRANLILDGGSIVCGLETTGSNQQMVEGTLTVASNSTIGLGGSDRRRITLRNGSISGSGSLTILGGTDINDILQLDNSWTSTHNGNWIIDGGRLVVYREDHIHDSAAVVLNSPVSYLDIRSDQRIGSLSGSGVVQSGISGTFVLTVGGNGADSAFSGFVGNGSGTVGLTKEGTGILTLSGANSYSGGTTIGANWGAAVLRAAATGALGTGPVAFDPAGNSSTARLELTGGINLTNAISLPGRTNGSVAIENVSGNNALTGPVAISIGGSDYRIQSDAGTLTLGTITSIAGGARNVTLQGAGNGVVGGVIANGNATLSITKEGAGAWTLSAANTYTGPTTITTGTLHLTGSLTSPVTVLSGATITGTGTINGNLTVNPGAKIASRLPGNPLTVRGSLTLAGTVNLTDAGGFGFGTYTLLTYAGTLIDNGLTIGTTPNPLYSCQLDTTVAGQIRLIVRPTFASWQMAHFTCTNCPQAAATANPAGDEIANLIKYAVGLDPALPAENPVQFSKVSTNGFTYLRVSTPRDPAATDVLIEGVSSGTLTNWTTDTVIESNTPSFFRVRDAYPIETNSQRFLKLRFVQP